MVLELCNITTIQYFFFSNHVSCVFRQTSMQRQRQSGKQVGRHACKICFQACSATNNSRASDAGPCCALLEGGPRCKLCLLVFYQYFAEHILIPGYAADTENAKQLLFLVTTTHNKENCLYFTKIFILSLQMQFLSGLQQCRVTSVLGMYF